MFIVCFKIFKQYIWAVLINLHVPVKEVEWKSKKAKLVKISSLREYHFPLIKIQEGTKKRRYFFCRFGSHSEYFAQSFQRYHPGTFISNAMQKSHCKLSVFQPDSPPQLHGFHFQLNKYRRACSHRYILREKVG